MDMVRAPDEALRGEIGLLSPGQRAQLGAQLSNFTPTTGQALAARLAGVDIEAQRARFKGLLGQ
jgi:hypothetical protein